MKTLLIIKAVVEMGAGLAVAWLPVTVTSLLLGLPLERPAGTVIARFAGAALLSLGMACWMARRESHSSCASGLILALLIYDVLIVGVLLHAHLELGLSGIALWPAVALHSGLAIASLLCLGKGRRWPQPA